MLYYIILYYIILYYIMIYYVILYHIVLCYFTWYYMMLYDINYMIWYHMVTYIYIYIYMFLGGRWSGRGEICGHFRGGTIRLLQNPPSTPNLPTSIMDFRGFDSSTILILRGGIPRPIKDFPECLSQAILGGVMLVGGLGGRLRNVWLKLQMLNFFVWILAVSLLRLLDSNFPGNSLWAWEFHPLRLRCCLSQSLWNPES